MNYLVTGGAGFIGSNIVKALLSEEENVRVLDNFSTGKRENILDFINNPKCKIFNYGFTDIGKPLDLFVISNKKIFNREKLTQDGATVILINNGIHPGEPDGIDACIKLTEDILSGNISLPDNVVL
jgi:nucleoside-diphosphate-sugar epimerase